MVKILLLYLVDNAAAKRLIDMLPAEINLNDFNHTEKIGYFKISLPGTERHEGMLRRPEMCVFMFHGVI